MNTIWRYYKFSILWSIVIAILTLVPTPDIPSKPLFEIPNLDKIAHFGIFAILSFILNLSMYQNGGKAVNRLNYQIFTILISLAYGGLIELIQSKIPGRSGDILDFLADFVGILLGVVTFSRYLHYIGKQRS